MTNGDQSTILKSVIILLLIIIVVMQQCNKSNRFEKPIIVTKVEKVTTIDTVTVIKVDTVTKYVTLEVPVPTYSEDSIIKTYNKLYTDSNLNFNLTADVDGTLVGWKFDYKLKVPKLIEKTITIKDSVTVTNHSPRNMFFLNGAVIGSETSFDVGLGLSFYQKKGYLYQINYLPISKSIMVGVGYQFK